MSDSWLSLSGCVAGWLSLIDSCSSITAVGGPIDIGSSVLWTIKNIIATIWILNPVFELYICVRLYGQPSQVILLFEYRTPIVSGIQMELVFGYPVFRSLLYWTCLLFKRLKCVWLANYPVFKCHLNSGQHSCLVLVYFEQCLKNQTWRLGQTNWWLQQETSDGAMGKALR